MIPFFVIFAAFCLIFMILTRRGKRQAEKNRASFWKLEQEANHTRRQDISSLDYIYIPLELLPFGVDASPETQHLESVLRELDSQKILNLNQYTNTELKLTYGAANLAFLSECDERFTQLIRTLYQWSCLLLEHEHWDEAIQVAEYSIEIGSDIAGCYYMLGDYYASVSDAERLHTLRESAEALTGLQAEAIRNYLNKFPI